VGVSAQDVMKLREKTGAGIMDCKRALADAGGDFEKAVKILREKGIADAKKRTGREAKEGLIAIAFNGDRSEAVMVEMNCETDFVSRTEKYQKFVEDLSEDILKSGISRPDELSEDIKKRIQEMAGSFGENLILRRIARIKKSDPERSYIGSYVHLNGRAGVIAEIVVDKPEIIKKPEFEELVKNILLQIASMAPISVSRDDVPEDVVKEQREVFAKQAKESGKPEKIIDKIVEGRLGKFFSEVCLLEQKYVKQNDITVGKYIEDAAREIGGNIEIKSFVRFKLGEE